MSPSTGGTVGSAFSATVTGSGGQSPYTFELTSGALPPGLSLAAGTGAITGTPTLSGVFTFSVMRSDTAGAIQLVDLAIVVGTSGTPALLVSEMRLRGPMGALDEYVELVNHSGNDIVVNSSDGSAGWSIANSGGTLSVIPNGTVIPKGGHWLVVGSAFSLASYPAANGQTIGAGDGILAVDLPDDQGVAVFQSANSGGYSLATRLDAVGSTAESDMLFREGTGLPTLGASTPTAQIAWVRKFNNAAIELDSGDNSADFALVATDGGVTYGASGTLKAILGGPNPQSLQSGVVDTTGAEIPWNFIDPSRTGTQQPNRLVTANSSVDYRFSLTNGTNRPMEFLRLRAVFVTTLNSPIIYAPTQGDLRPSDAPSVTVTVAGNPATANASYLTQPSMHPLLTGGLPVGGMNSAVDVPLPLGGLAPGATVSTNLRSRLAKSGLYGLSLAVEGVFRQVAANPIFSPASSVFVGTTSVTLTTTTPDAEIRYTIDGATPTASSPLYGGPVSLSSTTTLRAIAVKSGMMDSGVAAASYVVEAEAPSVSPAAGTYTGVQSVMASSSDASASIRYTTDGSTPVTSSPLYSGALSVGNPTVLKLRAFKLNAAPSAVVSVAYDFAAPPPTISPSVGTPQSSQMVTLTTAIAGGAIHYTLDGTEPTSLSRVYSAPFLLLNGGTVKAKTFKNGWAASATAAVTYEYALSMAPVSSASGTVPAIQGFFPDDTTGDCASETVTTFLPPDPSKILKAVFYFPWHLAPPSQSGACDGDTGGYWCKCVVPTKNDMKPLAGYYDSSDGATIKSHMDTLAANDVDVVGIEWTGVDKKEEAAAVLLEPNVVTEAGKRGMKVVILYDPAISLGITTLNVDVAGTANQIRTDFGRLKALFFGRDEYLTIEGKPVVYFYISRQLSGNVKSFFDSLRADIGDFYLVADHLWYAGTNFETLRQTGARAVTGFHGADLNRPDITTVPAIADYMAASYYEAARQGVLDLNNVNVFPGVFPQYDDRSVSSAGCPLNDPRPTQHFNLTGVDDWKYMMRRIGNEENFLVKKVKIRRNCSEHVIADQSQDTSIMWVYSFNEWAEGSGIEPLVEKTPRYPFGFGNDVIQALAAHSFSQTSGNLAMTTPFARGPVGDQEGHRPNFAWDGVVNATGYSAEIKDASGTVVQTVNQGATIHVADGALAAGTYSWRVRAQFASEAGPWSAWKSFTIPDDDDPEEPEPCNANGVCDDGETEAACPLDNCGTTSCTPSAQSFSMTSQGALSGETHTGIPITFTANTATMTTGLPILWDMGTGDHLEGASVTYTYSQPGNYTVVLTSNDLSCGETQLTSVVVPVTPLSCYWQATQAGWQEASCRSGNSSNACFSGETAIGENSGGGCGGGETCCALTYVPPPDPCSSNSLHSHTGSCGSEDSCGHHFGTPVDPGCPLESQSCGAIGGLYCLQSGSCPAGTVSGGSSPDPCAICCVPDSQQNVCDDPQLHNHTGSCGSEDSCGHPFGTPVDPGCPLESQSCGAIGGLYCMGPGASCPAGTVSGGSTPDPCPTCCVPGEPPPTGYCGDGACDPDEDPSSCWLDCGLAQAVSQVCGVSASCDVPRSPATLLVSALPRRERRPSGF